MSWQPSRNGATGGPGAYQASYHSRALQRIDSGEEPRALEARSLLSAGRKPEALEAAGKGLAEAKDPRVRSKLYVVSALSGSADALQDLRSALYEDPDNVEALLAISDALAAKGDYRRALGYQKRAAELSPGNAGIAQRARELERLAGPQQ